jgi:acyl-coenzyme A thioesterase PaaI-like protein
VTTEFNGTLPWTKSCFVCGETNPHGLRLRSRVERGVVVLDYVTRESDLGWRHIVHGGITMTLLDEVMTWAAILHTRTACVAAEMTTRLRRAVEVGMRLRVEGRCEAGKARLVMTTGQVMGEDGAILATAAGKYMPMTDAQVSLCATDFVESAGSIPAADIFARPTDTASR